MGWIFILSVVISLSSVSFGSGHIVATWICVTTSLVPLGVADSSFVDFTSHLSDPVGGTYSSAFYDSVGGMPSLCLLFLSWPDIFTAEFEKADNPWGILSRLPTTVLFAIIAVSEVDLARPLRMLFPVIFDLDIATQLQVSSSTGNRAHWSFFNSDTIVTWCATWVSWQVVLFNPKFWDIIFAHGHLLCIFTDQEINFLWFHTINACGNYKTFFSYRTSISLDFNITNWILFQT